jgi:hypothetical protein
MSELVNTVYEALSSPIGVIVLAVLAVVGVVLTVVDMLRQGRDKPVKKLALDYATVERYRTLRGYVDLDLVPGNGKKYQSLDLVRFIIGNKGNVTLTKDDIIGPITLSFRETGFELVSVVSDMTWVGEEIKIQEIEGEPREFRIEFSRIEPGAGTLFEWLISTGESVTTQPILKCDIKNQKAKDSSEAQYFYDIIEVRWKKSMLDSPSPKMLRLLWIITIYFIAAPVIVGGNMRALLIMSLVPMAIIILALGMRWWKIKTRGAIGYGRYDLHALDLVPIELFYEKSKETKQRMLDNAMEQIEKQFGKNSILRSGQPSEEKKEGGSTTDVPF